MNMRNSLIVVCGEGIREPGVGEFSLGFDAITVDLENILQSRYEQNVKHDQFRKMCYKVGHVK